MVLTKRHAECEVGLKVGYGLAGRQAQKPATYRHKIDAVCLPVCPCRTGQPGCVEHGGLKLVVVWLPNGGSAAGRTQNTLCPQSMPHHDPVCPRWQPGWHRVLPIIVSCFTGSRESDTLLRANSVLVAWASVDRVYGTAWQSQEYVGVWCRRDSARQGSVVLPLDMPYTTPADPCCLQLVPPGPTVAYDS